MGDGFVGCGVDKFFAAIPATRDVARRIYVSRNESQQEKSKFGRLENCMTA